jgi:hypothetical protein
LGVRIPRGAPPSTDVHAGQRPRWIVLYPTPTASAKPCPTGSTPGLTCGHSPRTRGIPRSCPAARLPCLTVTLRGVADEPGVSGSGLSAGRGSCRVVRRTRDWVTKTDLTQYVGCPYAFWLLDQGQISQADIIDEPQRQRLLEGRAFEEHAVKRSPRPPPSRLPSAPTASRSTGCWARTSCCFARPTSTIQR